jgi:hypothetical protein
MTDRKENRNENPTLWKLKERKKERKKELKLALAGLEHRYKQT